MKKIFLEEMRSYDGTQLSSHYAYRQAGIAGDSILAFIGPANVALSEMLDVEDVIQKEPIRSDKMLHFIIELFGRNLESAVWAQRLFMAILADELNQSMERLAVERRGDDLYFAGKKLSVSIATVSPVSAMVHSALNVVSSGAPIPVASLSDMRISTEDFAESVMNDFVAEVQAVEFAKVKVRWTR